MISNYLKFLQSEKYNYNEEDLSSHHGVSAIIYDKNKRILMQEHVKLKFWTIPVGKVKSDETVIQGLKKEILEECGIKLIKFKEVVKFNKKYTRHGKNVTVFGHIFEVEKYSGTPRNLEPQKHKQQIFMSIEEIKKKAKLSDSTIQALKYLEK